MIDNDLFDSHCHLQSRRFGEHVDRIIKNAERAGVSRFLCCTTCEKDWDAVLALANDYGSVIPAFGIHPWYMQGISDIWQEKLVEYLKRVPSALGECGLDFAVKNIDRSLQEGIFRKQLLIAQDLNLPVSIHCRKAWERLVSIVKEVGGVPAGGCIHSYSGSHELISVLERMGFYISFSGTVTNKHSVRVHKAAETVSDEHLLIETDSPDLLPYTIPEREKCRYNEPAYLVAVVQSIAELRGKAGVEIAETTYNNALRLFKDIIR